MTDSIRVSTIAVDDYELYMPLLEAMRHDLEETLAEKPNAVFYPGRSMVVNRFLTTLRDLMGVSGQTLPSLDEREKMAAALVFAIIQRYCVALLKFEPSRSPG
jgi:hypothetical protein